MNGTLVHLVRHGAHDALGSRLAGRAAIALNPQGRAEAAAAAGRLAGARPDALHSSPVARAVETAEILGQRLGLAVEPQPDLSEIDFGAWEGEPFDSLDPRPDWQRWNSDRGRGQTPGGERIVDVEARVARWLAMVAQSGLSAVVAVSHADVIKVMVAHVIGLPMHFHDRVEVAPGSLSTLAVGDRGMRLLSLNEACHG